MEDAQFDTLAKALAGRRSRRAMLRYGVAALVGAALSGLRLRPASAQEPPPDDVDTSFCFNCGYINIKCHSPATRRWIGDIGEKCECGFWPFKCHMCKGSCRTYNEECTQKYPEECRESGCWAFSGAFNVNDPSDCSKVCSDQCL